MSLYIKDKDGKVLFTEIFPNGAIPVTQECEKIEELMKAECVQLAFNAPFVAISSENGVQSNAIPVGSSVSINIGNGWVDYYLFDPYIPVQKDEMEYEYKPIFYSKIHKWSKIPFFFYTGEGANMTREPDWELTGSASYFMECFNKAIYHEIGVTEELNIAIASGLPASAYLKFDNTDLLSGLNSIATAFETEWYIQGDTIYLGKVSQGEAVTLEVGENVKVPSVSNKNEGYFNRVYAFGGTRNITNDYNGASTNSIVNKRLTLSPKGFPYGFYDIEPDVQIGNQLVKILYFDNIYPRATEDDRNGVKITDVAYRLVYRLDSEGNKIELGKDDDGKPIYEMYSVWYFRIPFLENNVSKIESESDAEWRKRYVEYIKGLYIEGTNITCSFESGALNGREFELSLVEDDETIKTDDGTPLDVQAGMFAVVFVEENNLIIPTLPTGGLVPADGDYIALFNIKLPSSYIEAAYIELEAAMKNKIAELREDQNTYTLESNVVAFAKNNPNLYVGRKVIYKNGDYSFETRITKLVTKLDIQSEQTITIGNNITKGAISELKEEVKSANTNIDIIKALNDQTKVTMNAYTQAQMAMAQGFANIKKMWQFDPDNEDTIYSIYNVWSDKAISSKGFSNSNGDSGDDSGSGVGLNITQLWEELAKADTSKVIDYTHMPSKVKSAVSWVESVTDDTTEGAIDKWNEIVAFLDGIQNTTLNSILSTYATKSNVEATYATKASVSNLSSSLSTLTTTVNTINGNYVAKTRKISAGIGLSGGGDLTADRTLSLATVGTAGTYTKVVVDAYGRVTGSSTLLASDIPTLPISKISGVYEYDNTTGIEDTTVKPHILTYIGSDFAFIDSKFYNGQTANSNRVQVGYGYAEDFIKYRRYYNGWSNWKTVAFTDVDKLTPNSGILSIDGILEAKNAVFSGSVTIGGTNGVTISYDADAQMLKFSKGIYSLGAISSKGISDGTSGGDGSGVNLSAVWDSLTTNTDAFKSSKIHIDHIPTLTTSKISDFARTVEDLLPTNVSQLYNDAGYITSSAIANKADKATTLAGYGIADAVPYLNLVNAANLKSIGVGYINANGANGENGGVISFGIANYQTQIQSDYLGNYIYWRVNNNGTLSAWRKFIDTNNYVDYAVTLTTQQTITALKTFSAGINTTKISGITDTGLVANLNAHMLDGLYKHNFQKAVYDYVNNSSEGTANITTSPTLLASSYYNGTDKLGGNFQFYDTKFFSSQANTSNRVQMAYGYDVDSINYRRYNNGSWSAWRKVAFEDEVLTRTNSDYYAISVNSKLEDGKVRLLLMNNNVSKLLIGYDEHGSMFYDYTTAQTLRINANGNLEFTKNIEAAKQLVSNIATGTAPLVVKSTTMVSNLNANYVGGKIASDFAEAKSLSSEIDLNSVNGYGILCNPRNAWATPDNNYPVEAAGTLFYGNSAYSISSQIYGIYGANRWFARTCINAAGERSAWKEFAFLDVTTLTPSNGKLSIAGALSVSYTAEILGLLQAKGNITTPTLTVTTINIGDATLSWDSTNGMLKVDKGLYSTGAISSKGVSDSPSGIAIAQFGLWFYDTWMINVSDIYSYGNLTNLRLADGESAVNGDYISITCNAFIGKLPIDIEVFSGQFLDYTAPSGIIQLIPYKIDGNKAYFKLFANGTIPSGFGFKIKVY